MFIDEDVINKKKGKTCTGGSRRTPILKLISFNIYFSKKEVRMHEISRMVENIIYAEMIAINMIGG